MAALPSHLQHVLEELFAIAVPLQGLMDVEVQHTEGLHLIVSSMAILEEQGGQNSWTDE